MKNHAHSVTFNIFSFAGGTGNDTSNSHGQHAIFSEPPIYESMTLEDRKSLLLSVSVHLHAPLETMGIWRPEDMLAPYVTAYKALNYYGQFDRVPSARSEGAQ
jgi:hypothetical protein